MAAGSTDEDYQRAFKEKILPSISKFKPEAVIVSAGFDAHTSDPLGAIDLTTPFYGWMTQRALEIADQHADGRLISVLEGGYNLDALADSICVHLGGLLGKENSEMAP